MFFFYKFLTYLIYPFIIILIYFRKIIKKEDPNRFKEKILFQKNNASSDKLVWFHGASIGELNSVIPIVKHFLKSNKNLKILITTVTLSSGKIFEDEFKNETNVVHKYFPVDIPHLVKDFIKKWNPSLAVFIDSEIWPNFIFEIKKKNIPIVLLNARITDKTLRRWSLFKNFAKKIFLSFNICIASSINSKENLERLGVNKVKYYGNLKYINNPKRYKELEKVVTDSLKSRKIWLAASTHKNEEKFCLRTHQIIKNKYPNILTIIAPRHINRTREIMNEIKKSNLRGQVIDDSKSIKENTDIALINSFGSLNKYYDHCKNIFMGKSLSKKLALVGGQNPIEAARFGCKIYHGPYVYNFLEVYNFLKKNKISEQINSEKELSSKIIFDIESSLKINDSKLKEIEIFGKNIFDSTIQKLDELI